MTIEMVRHFLGWCALLNMGLLLLWFLLFVFANNSLYRLHTLWFELSKQRFNELHYLGMMFYKLAIFLLNVMPYIALLIIS